MATKSPPTPVPFRTVVIIDPPTARFERNAQDTLDSLVAAVLDLQARMARVQAIVTGSL